MKKKTFDDRIYNVFFVYSILAMKKYILCYKYKKLP